jgi:hypothetical protein
MHFFGTWQCILSVKKCCSTGFEHPTSHPGQNSRALKPLRHRSYNNLMLNFYINACQRRHMEFYVKHIFGDAREDSDERAECGGASGPVGVAGPTGGGRPPLARRTAEVRARDTPRPRRARLASARAARPRRPPPAYACAARRTVLPRAWPAGAQSPRDRLARRRLPRAASAACMRAAAARIRGARTKERGRPRERTQIGRAIEA